MRVYAASTLTSNLPLAGCAAFWSVLKGFFYIFLISIYDIIDKEQTIDTLKAYLDGLDDLTMEKIPQFTIGEGQHFYSPIGCIPIAVPIGAENKLSSDYASLISYPILDTKALASVSPAVQGEIAAALTRITTRTPAVKIFTGNNKKAVIAYLQNFKTVEEKEAPEAK